MSSATVEKPKIPFLHFFKADNRYEGDGWSMAREEGELPNGEPVGRHWILRNAAGEFVDHHQYRNDLAARYGLHLDLGS